MEYGDQVQTFQGKHIKRVWCRWRRPPDAGLEKTAAYQIKHASRQEKKKKKEIYDKVASSKETKNK